VKPTFDKPETIRPGYSQRGWFEHEGFFRSQIAKRHE
jgi:hypothetical protein